MRTPTGSPDVRRTPRFEARPGVGIGYSPRRMTAVGDRGPTTIRGGSPAGLLALLAMLVLPSMLGGCTFLPAEFNMSPFYRHRLDENGEVLELDVLWPIVHYEQTPEGGDDFRIRPLWRWVTQPPEAGYAHRGTVQEHQFLWPFGRVVSDDIETSSRLFPLWWHRVREGEDGQRETDWYFLFPFVWGGGNEDGSEDYFALFPLFASIPEFLVYDRFSWFLFPLYLGLEKDGQSIHQVIWPLLGWNVDHAGKGREYAKLWPLFSYDHDPARYTRHWLLWPLIGWGWEKLWTEDPTWTLWLWPLFGRQSSETVDSWTVFWPFFQDNHDREHYREVNILWPFYQSRWAKNEDNLEQWWLWPLIARTESDRFYAWNFLWPLVWIRTYLDPEGVETHRWVVPFYTHVRQDYHDGGADDFYRFWPFFHTDTRRDGSGEWSLLSPWPYRGGNAYGVDEAYGWLWTLARSRSRTATDHSFELAANLYTSRTRRTDEGKTRTQSSVPFLYSWDGDEDGGVLRLFQFLPIPFTGSGTSSEGGSQ